MGPCVRRKSFSKYNVAEKADWAKQCGVAWSAASSSEGLVASAQVECDVDYTSHCPDQWTFVNGICEAPAHYKGKCGHVQAQFYSASQKKAFAEACNAPWAC